LAGSGFTGFPAEGLKFMRALERNNRREWFQPRKHLFEVHVKAPMVALVEEVNRSLRKIAPDYVTEPANAIYRIYRDTRFSNDKTPYKTHIAATFRKRGYDKHAGASLYFSVSQKNIEIAGGVYMPGPEQLLAIRTHLAEHHEDFRRVTRNTKLRRLMQDLKGEELSRVPKGFAADHPAADLIRKKQWLYFAEITSGAATTPQIIEEIVTRFRAMVPVVEFLSAPLRPHKVRAEDLLV
jgi:uncharacterized protein (TIGR02453 family)